MCTHVHWIRTYYPHWGQYSSINRFIKYVNQEKFRIGVQVVPMGDNNFPISNKWARHYFRRLVRRNGIQAYDLNDLVAELAALRQWRRGRIDILHYLDGEHSLQYLPLLLRKLSILKPRPPIVATFHQPPEKLDSLLNIDIVRLLDHVVVLAPEQASYFEQYLPARQVSLILLGVDVDHFQPGTESKERGKFKCISVGSWLRDYDAVLAVAEMLQSHPDIEFHVVSSVVAPPSHLGNIYIYTDIDDKALLRMYQQSDVLFLPMIGATANNAILEGIACGLPVVSTDMVSLRAYLPGKEAILIPGNTPELLANALLNLYHHPEIRSEMALSARQRAMELSWYNIASEYEAMYSEMSS